MSHHLHTVCHVRTCHITLQTLFNHPHINSQRKPIRDYLYLERKNFHGLVHIFFVGEYRKEFYHFLETKWGENINPKVDIFLPNILESHY